MDFRSVILDLHNAGFALARLGGRASDWVQDLVRSTVATVSSIGSYVRGVTYRSHEGDSV